MCHDTFSERLSAYADGELGLIERGRIAWHLRRCATCAAEMMTLRRLNMLLREADVAPRSLFQARVTPQDVTSQPSAPQARPAAAASGNGRLAYLVFGESVSAGRRPLRPVLPSLIVIAFAGLALVPATRSVISHHVRTELLRDTTKWDPTLAREIALRHPQDLQIQMAFDPRPFTPVIATVLKQTDKKKQSDVEREANSQRLEHVEKLQNLAQRFPNSPSLYANELRYLTNGLVNLTRREDEMSLAHDDPKIIDVQKLKEIAQPDPKALADFEAAAKAGERLDPDNAYFPMMHALWLFASYRDPEARQALQRAGEKPRWEEYTYDEPLGQLRVQTEMYGEQNAIERIGINATVLFPQYAALRATARLSMYFVMEEEKAGHYEEGLRIRRSLMRCGSLMRVQSHPIIGSLVGIAIARIATGRPGGKPKAKPDAKLSNEERQAHDLQNYYAYLERIDHTEDARWARAEITAGDAAKSAFSEPNGFDSQWQMLMHLEYWHGASLLVLSNLLMVLLVGGAVVLAARFKPRPGFLVQRYLGRLALNMGMLVLILGLVAWQYQMFSRGVALYLLTLFGEVGDGGVGHMIAAMGFLFSGLVPLWTTFAFIGISRRWRVPVTKGLERGWRAFTLPIAAVLALVYAGTILPIVRQEEQVKVGLDRQFQSEGRYIAGLNGKSWPGPTP